MGSKTTRAIKKNKELKRKETEKQIDAIKRFNKLGISSLDVAKRIPKDVDMFWDNLEKDYYTVAKNIVTQLSLCNELIKQYGGKLKANKELSELVIGLARSYTDLANDAAIIKERHMENGAFKKGKIDKEDLDSIMEYLDIMGNYTAISERCIRLASRSYLDVITKIATDPDMQLSPDELEVVNAYKEAFQEEENARTETHFEGVNDGK